MKILYVTNMFPTLKYPGGGVFITKRIEALLQLDTEVEAYAVIYNESKLLGFIRKMARLEIATVDDGNEVIYAPNSKIVYNKIRIKVGVCAKLLNYITFHRYASLRAYLKLVPKLKNKNYNIVHAHWLYPTGRTAIAIARYLKIPCIVTCHGSDINIGMNKIGYRKQSLKVLNDADKIEFVSNALYNQAKTFGYLKDNAIVIPNGIDKIISDPTKIQTRNKKIVGFVGNLIDIKRAQSFPTIIKRISHLYQDSIEFYIVGEGNLKEWIQSELQGFPVRFFGYVEHEKVLDLMREMDVMMLPSKNEGWPCVVLEAHSCGTPVVGSANGGIPEAIGDSRLIVKEGIDFEERFARSVLDVLENRIIVNSIELQTRATEYIWTSLQKRSVELYEQLQVHQ